MMSRQSFKLIPVGTFGASAPFPRARRRLLPLSAKQLLLPILTALLPLLLPLPLNPFLGTALGVTWPVSAAWLSPSLGYHQTYTAADGQYVHSGIDIPASAGAQVSAPVSGTVSFVGNVPDGDSSVSGGGEGCTMSAVSVKMDDGRTLTLMPFASISVTSGQEVSEGQALGTLAPSGDRSSNATHLHMGLKANGTYYDPMSLFGAASAQAASSQEDVTPVASTASAGAVSQAESTYAQNSLGLDFNDQTTEEFSAQESVQPQESLGTITSGSVQWQPAGVMSKSLAERVGQMAYSLADACAAQCEALTQGLHSLAYDTGIPFLALSLVLMLVVLLAMTLVLFGITVLASKVLAKKNSLLCSRREADTIERLFPAPGTSFITRGRLAQRR